MSIIDFVKKENLEPEAVQTYDEREQAGTLTNMVKTLLHSWASFTAMEFYPVRNELIKLIGEQAVYFYCYAISTEDECLVCSVYHAQLLKKLKISFDEFKFTEIETLLVRFGRALVRDANNIDLSIYRDLKKNFSDAEIVLITAVGCKMIASNLFNSALKVEPDKAEYIAAP